MMKHLLLLTNLALSIVAVMLTMHLLEEREKGGNGRSSDVKPMGELVADAAEDALPRQEIPREAAKRIERKNLFHVDRFYDDGTLTAAGGVGAAEKAGPKLKEEYVLTSTIQIGKGLAAIIVVSEAATSRSSIVRRTISSSRSSRPPIPTRPTSSRSKTSSKKKGGRGKVYRLNDPVGELGYVVSEIQFGVAILTKEGAEPITLETDRRDETSMARREVAKKESEVKTKLAKADAAKAAALAARATAAKALKKPTSKTPKSKSPGPPPPPPPPPISLPGTSGGPPRVNSSSKKTPYVRPRVTTQPKK